MMTMRMRMLKPLAIAMSSGVVLTTVTIVDDEHAGDDDAYDFAA